MMESDTVNSVDITFFVPCLNEEEFIISTIETIRAAVARNPVSYEILIYDDHSTDSTLKVATDYKELHSELPIRIFTFPAHRGLIPNYIDSSFQGRGRYLFIVGGDDDVPQEYLFKVLEKLNTADVIIPYFESDMRHGFRRRLSSLYTQLTNVISGYPLKYYNGAVHLRGNIMRWHSQSSGVGFLAELLVRVLNQGATWVEVEVPMRQKRSQVISVSFSLRNVFSVAGSLLRILSLRLTKKRSQSER